MAYGRIDVYWPEGRIESFLLEGDTVSVGRATGNTISLDTDTISRYHFSITREDERVFITDLDSANGTFVDGKRLTGNEPFQLEDVEEIMIGYLRLLYNPLDDSPTLPISPIEDETQRLENTLANFRIEFDTMAVQVWPASNSTIEMYITNASRMPQRYSVRAEGMPADWIRINRPEVLLDPDQAAQVLLNFKPLRRSDTVPGEYRVRVTVSLKDMPEISLTAELQVTVRAFNGMGMALANPVIDSRDPINLYIMNYGNESLPVSVGAVDKSGKLSFSLPQAPINIPPGQRVQVTGHAKVKGLALFGGAREFPIAVQVQAHTPAHYLCATPAKVIIHPILPSWALITIGGIALSIIAVLIVLASSLFARPPQPTITSFTANKTRLAQGEALVLNWSATDIADYALSLNATPFVSALSGDILQTEIDTQSLSGSVLVSLEGRNGRLTAQASLLVDVYRPVLIQNFTVTPNELVRNVVGTLQISWDAPGALETRLSGLEGVVFSSIEPVYGAAETLDNIQVIPTGDFTVSLSATNNEDTPKEQSVSIRVLLPMCAIVNGPVEAREGPNLLNSPRYTAEEGERFEALAQDVSGAWVELLLPGGVLGWVPSGALDCDDTFAVEDLRKEALVPPVPTLTAAPSPTFTLSPTQSPPRPTAAATRRP